MTALNLPAGDKATSAAPSLHLQVFASPYHKIEGSGDRTFSPVTSTLIYGDTDAVLVDAQFLREDVDALANMIAATGRKLTTIYITHGHADHYFGIDRLMDRFPGSRSIATKAVVDYLRAHSAAEFAQFSAMFGDELILPTTLPQPLEEPFITLEGERLCIIEVGQGDIPCSTILYVPLLGAVIAGDVAYNGIHQMLGLSGPKEWEKWIESVDKIEALNPIIVVAGHKRPGTTDDAIPVLDNTRSYIRDFANAAAASSSTRDIVSAMQTKYPEHGNLATLLYSAAAVMKRRSTTSPCGLI
jgi:glyoxylase-like metal-dependent hydrolase (beta-lactamase superfamily II)